MAYGKSQIVGPVAGGGTVYPRTITFNGPKRSVKKSAAGGKSMRLKGTMKRSRRK
jgi:hypothetical protein